MGAGLDRPPVVARGDDDGIDAVHDAFVVRGSAIRIHGGEGIGIYDAVYDVVAAVVLCLQGLRGDLHAGSGQAQIGQVGQNAQAHAATCYLFDGPGHGFSHGVDGIGAHGVAHVHDQVGNDHGPARGVGEYVHFDIAAAAPQADQHPVAAVCDVYDLFAILQDGVPCAVGIRDVGYLHLGAHDGPRAGGLKAA